jgi:hypothetical protein
MVAEAAKVVTDDKQDPFAGSAAENTSITDNVTSYIDRETIIGKSADKVKSKQIEDSGASPSLNTSANDGVVEID